MKLSPIQNIWLVLMLCFGVALYAYPAHAATLKVPSEYSTIQSAVNAAVDGDTILVAPGTYYENIYINGNAWRSLQLLSEAGPEQTVIDGSNLGQVIRIGAVSSLIIEGFTIQKGNPGTSLWPAGIRIESGRNISLRNNIVRDNTCGSCIGVGIGVVGIRPGPILIENNVIENNSGPGCGGGAIGVTSALNLQIANNLIRNNHCNVGGGIYIRTASGRTIIMNNEIINNSANLDGGGIWASGVPISVIQNLIAGNTAESGGGIYTDVEFLTGNATSFTNNTIVNNLSQTGSEIHLRGDTFSGTNDTITLTNNSITNDNGLTAFFCDLDEPPVLSLISNNVYSLAGSAYGGACSDIYTGVNGNISLDAGYTDATNGNYRLNHTSQLIDAGNNNASDLPAEDMDGLPRIVDGNVDGLDVVDIGAYEFQFGSPIPPSPTITSSEYLPLVDGNSWTNVVDSVVIKTFTVIPGATLINGVWTKGVQRDDGQISYYTSDTNGIRFYGGYEPGPEEILLTFSPPIILLPATTELSEVINTEGTVTFDFPSLDVTLTYNYTNTSVVEAFETIDVPAGQFKALRAKNTMHIFGVSQGIPFDETSELTDWYAKLIGYVKTVSTDGDSTQTDELLSMNFNPPLFSSVLPNSRSIPVSAPATAFATITNPSGIKGTNCGISPVTSLPAEFMYQTTHSATNTPIGIPNTPVTILPESNQSFMIAITPSVAIPTTEVEFRFACSNTDAASTYVGLNTLLMSASDSPTPDIVALAKTVTEDGIANINGVPGIGAFAVAVSNVGATGSITVLADTGGVTLPVSISLCETNPDTGQCLSPIQTSVVTTIESNETATFAIFLTSTGNVPFDPANNRIFVRFLDAGGTTRGSTSVAVRTL